MRAIDYFISESLEVFSYVYGEGYACGTNEVHGVSQVEVPHGVVPTGKIPTAIKNAHREFWGLPALPEPIESWELSSGYEAGCVRFEGRKVGFTLEGWNPFNVMFNDEVPEPVRRELANLLRYFYPDEEFKVPKCTGGFYYVSGHNW